MRSLPLILTAVLLAASPASAGLIFVNADGTGDYTTIQAAINAAAAGSVIELADGTYRGVGNRDLDPLGKAITIRSASGRPAACIIDCEDLARGFYIHTAETSATVIRGLKIINGQADYGGGLRVDSADPRLVNLVVQDCHADQNGGGLYLRLADPLVNSCVVSGNSAEVHGGGIYVHGGDPLFYNDLIVGNEAFTCGGLFLYSADVTVRSCSFSDNEASDAAGGIAIRGETGGGADLTNCIVGSNPGPGSTIISALVTYSCVWGGYTGTGNIDANPQFAVGPGGNYYLAGTSPCLNAGSAAASTLCFTAADGSVCLSQLTTRSTEVSDTGTVDMGYHYGHYNAAAVPGSFATIQTAIDNMFSGETINVSPGHYDQRIDFRGRALTLVGTGGYAVTTLDGSSGGSVVTFVTGEGRGAVLRGFTVTGGLAGAGGGIIGDGAGPTVEQCRISSNHATGEGGGVAMTFGRLRLHDCVVYGNVADTQGGGLSLTGGTSRPELEDCLIQSNSAPTGGGLYAAWGTLRLTRTSFHKNTGYTNGGGGYAANATLIVTGCTFALNHAGGGATTGAGLHAEAGTLTADHTLIGGNTGGRAVSCTLAPTVSLACCDVFGNAGGDWIGCLAGLGTLNNNFSLDPLWCDLATGVTLHSNSPCLAANNPTCGQVGAGGSGCAPTQIVVYPDGSGGAATIQAAIDASFGGGIVLLSDGTFTGTGNRDLDYRGKKITVKSNSNLPYRTVIDCQGSSGSPHRGFYFHTGEDSTAVLQGVTIRNAWVSSSGGGINCTNASPKIVNCALYQNNAQDSGGGISAFQASPIIEDCDIWKNTANNAGGGLLTQTSYPVVRRCRFSENWALWGGGGIHNYGGSPALQRCTLERNRCDNWGGGMHSDLATSQPMLYNCVFRGNSAAQGGALYNRGGAAPHLMNCTLFGNYATTGGGLYNKTSSTTWLNRTIIASGTAGAATYCDATSTVNALCCDVYGNTGGDWTGCLTGKLGTNNNISLDPQFCNAGGLDLRLQATSPCAATNNPACGWIGAEDQTCGTSDVAGPVPDYGAARFRFEGCVPNPFNPVTTLRFTLPGPAATRLTVFSIDGRRVAQLVDSELAGGPHEIVWDGRDHQGRPAPAGIYIVELRAGRDRATRRMALIK